MYGRGIERKRSLGGRAEGRRGTALVGSLIVLVGIFGVLYATTVRSVVEVRDSHQTMDAVRARALARTGFERGVRFLNQAVAASNAYGPLLGIQNLFSNGSPLTPFVAEPVLEGGRQVGAFSVSMTLESQTTESVVVRLDCTGYLPDAPANLPPGRELEAWESLSVSVEYALEPSDVFDYAYFINNWGWFYGSTIVANGSVRSNGQFDAAGYAPWVNSQPFYESVSWDGVNATLSGYIDDNGDGLADGNDGGIFAGWDIVDVQNVRGTGGNAENQHDFQGAVEMPNLSDLTQVEQHALDLGSSVSIGGTQVSNAVFGDEPGETGNLYLVGTATDPIVLDGPLVVRGNVIISGYVTGQGSIYAEGNVYVPDSVKYVDPPSTPRPADTTQAATEAWLSANWDKDFLGLFAAESIVVGDHTNPTWRYYVGHWMASSMNQSAEDAGEDGIPNTAAGRDGILGTADDDVLEGDGVFTVETYTQAHADLGLIPPGYSVGDPIPGTGEDIDGDGVFDPTITLADIDLPVPLDPAYWGGNIPAGGVSDYSDISTLYASQLDAVFYTNHTFAWLVLGSSPARINGALVSRNEDIVYGTPSIEMNYDCRLLGGNSGMAGELLPKVVQSPRIVLWRRLDADPNRYLGAQP